MGDPYDSELARKNMDLPGFKCAWEELMLLVEFVDKNRNIRNVPLQINGHPFTSESAAPSHSAAPKQQSKKLQNLLASTSSDVVSTPSSTVSVPEVAKTISVVKEGTLSHTSELNSNVESIGILSGALPSTHTIIDIEMQLKKCSVSTASSSEGQQSKISFS